ncbi:MAG: cysteine desulfurase [Clostridiales Family XIII bacterium]|jgi:cysteine desulfurase/selenocysteine lyase|nr:cysteine desulfurase [Clostridiales Family XIII bacterium]
MSINDLFPYGPAADGQVYGGPAVYGQQVDGQAFGGPAAYGLPAEGEIARIAAAYFPEFALRGGDERELGPRGDEAPGFESRRPEPREFGQRGPEFDSRGAALRQSEVWEPDFPRHDGPAGNVIDLRAPELRGSAGHEPDAFEQHKYIGDVSLAQIRSDFPILSETVEGKHLIWLDNAATTQRPRQVIDRISYYYEHENSNVHRGAHTLAARSTDAYEAARKKVADYIGAPSEDNIVFVRGTTEGINLVAQSYVKPLLRPGDEIVLTLLEHHANIVPWQIIAAETGAVLRAAPVDETGQIILSEYIRLFNSKTKFAAFAQVSNALGTITPASELIAAAHGFGVPVLVDGAQSVSHMPVNVTALDADFFVFSGHKVFGPTGIGALYGKKALLNAAKPYQGGGNMIEDVTFERTVYHDAPQKFEAGTGNIADAVGLGAALDYISRIGIANIAAWEHELLAYATGELGKIEGLRLIGTARDKASVLSFVIDGRSVEEIGQRLSREGIAVRAGHHCAQPILRHFGLEGTVRPSLAFYNTPGEIDALAAALKRLG